MKIKSKLYYEEKEIAIFLTNEIEIRRSPLGGPTTIHSDGQLLWSPMICTMRGKLPGGQDFEITGIKLYVAGITESTDAHIEADKIIVHGSEQKVNE